jgi:hypothetical protein
MTTVKFVKGVDVTTTSLTSATLPSVWLNSTRNLLANKFKRTSMKHTSLTDASCSKDTPKENNDEKIPPSWGTYSALMICSWNSNLTTYLGTPTSLRYPKT